MKDYNFDEMINRRGTNCTKYDTLKKNFGAENLIPLWVADMDFRTPDFILEALRKRMEHPVFGYTCPSEEYYDSIIRWNRKLHGWELKREWISFIPGIVKGIAFAIEKFTQEGDKIIIQPPVYHPFRLIPENMKRTVVNNPLRLVNGIYEMDFDRLESVIDDKCKMLILSNPHNPAGIVWSKTCLQELAAICAARNITVLSDEIHSEMTYPSCKHHPFSTVSGAAEACSITFAAPSKTFNIAGIVSSYAIVQEKHLRKEFYEYMEARELNQGTIFSYIATTAAYTHGAEWRRQMLGYVMKNVDFVEEYLKKNLPQIKVYRPQASFLVWLDCREAGLSHRKLITLFTEQAHLALNDGAMFGIEGNGYMRLNVGCPRSTLEMALRQLKNAFHGSFFTA
ncbi:MAG: PatB family C-S lyase [Tannerella sp.]|jgi:cystathionine beta-lyase|nr:PatB family C-S lyase [Tannerella sp.]